MMEPWDGPAALIFSDGDIVGASLDRNGLRPSRYLLTDDDYLILASEVGVLDIDPAKVLRKERLKPGALLVVDTVAGKVYEDAELKEMYSRRQPYGEWLYQHLLEMKDLPLAQRARPLSQKERARAASYRFFDYTWRDMREVILPMALGGSEPTASMARTRRLRSFPARPAPVWLFQQLFAQVNQPAHRRHPRSAGVEDTAVYVGADGNLLGEKPENMRGAQDRHPHPTSGADAISGPEKNSTSA
jgi:glutamate synthase (ferredoxin)